jgi:hypothetical protein
MKTDFSKSVGQEHQSSKFGCRIFENNSPIVSRLLSRTLTGRGLQIKFNNISAIGYTWFRKQKIKNNRQKDAYKGFP